MIRPPFSLNHAGNIGGGNCSMAGGVQLRFCRYVRGRFGSRVVVIAIVSNQLYKIIQHRINGA